MQSPARHVRGMAKPSHCPYMYLAAASSDKISSENQCRTDAPAGGVLGVAELLVTVSMWASDGASSTRMLVTSSVSIFFEPEAA